MLLLGSVFIFFSQCAVPGSSERRADHLIGGSLKEVKEGLSRSVNVPIPLQGSQFKIDSRNPKTVHYGNEAGVTALVPLYLEAVIKAGGLGKKIETFVDLYIAKYRPDVVVIYNERRIPCGVVEVKLPDPPPTSHEEIIITTTITTTTTTSSGTSSAPNALPAASSSRTLRSREKKPAKPSLPPADQQQHPKESGLS